MLKFGSKAVGFAVAAPLLALLATDAVRDRPARAAAPADRPVAQLQLPPANGELGFVLTAIAPAFRPGDEQCPQGLAGLIRDNYLETQSAAERARLSLEANKNELETRWKAYALGPNGTNVCANADTFDMTGRPIAKILQGRVAPGMNLDGDAAGAGGGDTCAHENFVGENGEQGVDNQAYRALGCTISWRNVDGKRGDRMAALDDKLANGEHSMVMLLRGVQSLVNDNDVTVILASTDDTPITDIKRNVLTGASFTVTRIPRYRNELKGRIVGGVLTTDPTDIRLSQRMGQGGIRGQRAEYDFRKGRLRLAFRPDGSIEGLLGAYNPIRTLIQSPILGGQGTALTAGIDCAAEYAALHKMADEIKDPATGKCTAVSAANHVKAVPAFVFDRPPARSPVATK